MKVSEVKKIVSNLKVLSKGTDKQKYKLAASLYKASHLDWSGTEYLTFNSMIATEINDIDTEVHRLIYAYQLMCKHKWTKEVQLEALEHLGWTRFVTAMSVQDKDCDPYAFMDKYYNMPLYKIKPKPAKTDDADRAYGFSLPKSYADKFDGILMEHGMTIINDRRHGVRSSMMSLLDSM